MNKETAGTGAHGDLSAHLVDLAQFLVGEITEVIGVMETFIKQRPEAATGDAVSTGPDEERPMGSMIMDDAAPFLKRFDNGALGSFEATRYALGRKNYNRFEINGSGGFIAFNSERLDNLGVYTLGCSRHILGLSLMLSEQSSREKTLCPTLSMGIATTLCWMRSS